jgi:hypothetical protein
LEGDQGCVHAEHYRNRATIPCDRRGEYLLWQRRFWEHAIRDDQDFERCSNYVHFNPVKHRLVSKPGEWPFSSLHRYVRAGILPCDWGGDDGADNSNFGERAEESPDCASLYPGYQIQKTPASLPGFRIFVIA